MSTSPESPPFPPSMAQPAVPPPSRRGRNPLLVGGIAVIGVCGLLCLIVGIVAAVNGGSSKATPTLVALATTPTSVGTSIVAAAGGQAATATPQASAAPKPTEAAKPTNTPKPEPTANPTNTPIPPPKVYGLNELASVKNWDMAVAGVERPGKEYTWSEFGNTSTAAGTWIIIAFDMKNTGKENFGVNTFDFELRAAGGIVYKFSTDGGTYLYPQYKKAQSIGGQVPPGVTVRYYLIFDVAPDVTDLQLVFKQDTRPVFAIGNAAP